ncbi:MAG: sigma-70 family RNA polymerase sigma factor [Eubacteriales bacterium]
MTDNKDLELIWQAKEGSSFALAQLLQKNYSILFKFLVKMTLDPELASDVTQDVMEKVVEKIHLYDENQASFSTWMIAISKNIVRDEWKKRKVRQKYIEYESPVTDYVDEIEKIVEKDEILKLLKRLPPKTRIPILMKHGHGYRYDEIAHIFKVPIGTIKSRIFNGLRKLREELDNGEGTKNRNNG